MKWLSRIGIDGFIVCLVGAIALAKVFPQAGLMIEPISLDTIANYGLTGVFFFYGLKLSPKALRSDLLNWRLHLVVQMSTFILFPVLALLIKPFFSESSEMMWLGIFFLAALPSTVSSSVVMVSIAKGNIPSAIFNASFSSLAGVFITPLWMSFFILSNNSGPDMTDIMVKLLLQVLLPVIIGLMLNKYFGDWATAHKHKLRMFDQSIILLIVYSSFCHSFSQHLFAAFSYSSLLLLGVGMIVLFLIVYAVIKWVCRLNHFNREDTITASFCGSKKSLVHGTVMSKVLFANSASVGIVLLPLMLYHALQILLVSAIAQRLAKEKQD